MMPAVFAQATFSIFLDILAVWAGFALLFTAIVPRQVALAKAACAGPPARLLFRGVLVSLSFVLLMAAWRSGLHALKIVSVIIVALAFGAASFGTAGLVQIVAARLRSRTSSRKRRYSEESGGERTDQSPLVGAFFTALALVLVVSPLAIPYLGWYVLAPILFVITGGISVTALLGMLSKKGRTVQNASAKYAGSVRIAYAVIGAVLTLKIGPVIEAARIIRIPVMVAMTDGTHLATDVYLPRTLGPYPVILIRTPNGKETVNVVEGVSRGYAVVVQDTRGRGSSRGDNLPFNAETDERPNDGWDTLEWLSTQAWCNRQIGTLGSGASGINQISTDGAGTDWIKSQHITNASPTLYQNIVYPGGILRSSAIEDWLKTAKFAPESLKQWVSHPDYDEYWLARDFADRWERVNWPAMHIGGWYDASAQGTIDTFVGFQTEGGPDARGKQRLIMGPWGHVPFSASIGDQKFPEGASPKDGPQDPWRWFDYTLKGVHNGIEALPAVTYYVMGDTATSGAPGNVWRTASAWPPVESTETNYYLRAGKLLSEATPVNEPAALFTFDPHNPVPTLGGAQPYLDSGPKDQRKIEERPDVLTFSTAPLANPLEVTGRVRAKIFVSSDAPDTDLFVKLCDMYPDGRCFNICEGQLRARFRYGFLEEEMMKPGEVYPLDIDLNSTSIIFNKGHRIQILVTSSSSPGFDVNPNTGEAFRANSRAQVAHNSLYLDAAHPSAIILPVVK